jgi:hypothetical protein
MAGLPQHRAASQSHGSGRVSVGRFGARFFPGAHSDRLFLAEGLRAGAARLATRARRLRLYAAAILPYDGGMFGQTKRSTMKTMTPSDGVLRVCAR